MTREKVIAREIAYHTAREIYMLDMRISNIIRLVNKIDYLDNAINTSEITQCLHDVSGHLETVAKMLDNIYDTQTTTRQW